MEELFYDAVTFIMDYHATGLCKLGGDIDYGHRLDIDDSGVHADLEGELRFSEDYVCFTSSLDIPFSVVWEVLKNPLLWETYPDAENVTREEFDEFISQWD